MVKQLLPFLALGTAFAQQPGEEPAPAATAFEPTVHDVSRYQDIWSKSPFEFEIVVEEIAIEDDTTFDDLRLSGYSDRGSYYVATIYDQKAPAEKIRIDSRKSSDENDGFKFIEVHRGVSYKQTEIELEKNGVVGKVGYDGKRLSAPLSAASGGGKGRKGAVTAQSRAAQTARAKAVASRTTSSRANKNNARTQQANTNQAQNNGNNNNAATGNTAAGSTDRNAVIQRLLERARQNQSGGTATPNAAATTDATAPKPRRRRVVLPPSTK